MKNENSRLTSLAAQQLPATPTPSPLPIAPHPPIPAAPRAAPAPNPALDVCSKSFRTRPPNPANTTKSTTAHNHHPPAEPPSETIPALSRRRILPIQPRVSNPRPSILHSAF